MMAKRVLTNITPVAKGYHGWILARCEVYFTKWHRHLCVASHSQLLWIISLLVQCWLVWLVSFSCATAFRIILPLWVKPSISFFRIQLDFCFSIKDSLNWMFSIFIPNWTPTANSQPMLCQYYLFSTWLTCNLNSLNSNDNRLLCMGSHCIRGQGETDSLFVLCQWSLGPGLIRGAKAYTTPNQLQPGQLNLSQTY